MSSQHDKDPGLTLRMGTGMSVSVAAILLTAIVGGAQMHFGAKAELNATMRETYLSKEEAAKDVAALQAQIRATERINDIRQAALESSIDRIEEKIDQLLERELDNKGR